MIDIGQIWQCTRDLKIWNGGKQINFTSGDKIIISNIVFVDLWQVNLFGRLARIKGYIINDYFRQIG